MANVHHNHIEKVSSKHIAHAVLDTRVIYYINVLSIGNQSLEAMIMSVKCFAATLPFEIDKSFVIW